jgi:hypothetical protein
MVKIQISAAAFAAIAATLPLGTVAFEPERAKMVRSGLYAEQCGSARVVKHGAYSLSCPSP